MEQTHNDADLAGRVAGLSDDIGRVDNRVGKVESVVVDLAIRLAKVETTLEFVRRDLQDVQSGMHEMRKELTAIRTTDFRILFGATISVSLALSGLMAKGFGWF